MRLKRPRRDQDSGSLPLWRTIAFRKPGGALSPHNLRGNCPIHATFKRRRLNSRHGKHELIRLAAAVALLLAAAPGDEGADEPTLEQAAGGIVQITIQQIVIRIPRADQRVPASARSMQWRESGGPRCIPARDIAGAMPASATVDLVLRDHRRVRARLGRGCQALDYYRGLYVAANRDGQVCAGRDAIRSRMGGQCDIVQFRLLQPAGRAR